MRLADFALAQKREEMARDGLLPGMRPGVVNALIESDGRAFERLEGHRAGDIGDAGETFRPQESEPANRVHRLGAVEQGEAFLGLQISRLKPGLLQCVRARHALALEETLPLLRATKAQDEPAARDHRSPRPSPSRE